VQPRKQREEAGASLLFSQGRSNLVPLFLTQGFFVDESSEGELGLRGAFIFAALVALLHACKQSADRALARRVLSGFEHLRKAFKELSVPHTRSIQAQILDLEVADTEQMTRFESIALSIDLRPVDIHLKASQVAARWIMAR